MQLFRRLQAAAWPSPTGRRRIRGLSTAELVGIIVIVGILGGLATSYITGLVSQSKTNAGIQNAQSLNATLTSALAAGGTVDTSTTASAITALNAGVTVGAGATAVTFQVNPPVNNPGSYSLNTTTNLFSYTTGNP